MVSSTEKGKQGMEMVSSEEVSHSTFPYISA